MRAVGAPAEGAAVELGPPPPAWYDLTRGRVRLSHRIGHAPWTHDRAAVLPPAPASAPPPPGLLAALEGGAP
jgi:hypothetical protein